MFVRGVLARVCVTTTTIAAIVVGLGAPAKAAPAVHFAINDVSIVEGNTGTTNLIFTISTTGNPAKSATVDYATADATAGAGSDYGSVSGTTPVLSSGSSTTVSVPISGDLTPEVTETFQVNLSNPSVDGVINDPQGIGTITNDDLPGASTGDATMVENGGMLSFTVSLDGTAPFDSVVSYVTTAGTATDGLDYTGVSSTLTITAGTTSGTIDVPLLDDTTYEGDEDLTVTLTPVSGVAVTDGVGAGTITEDDAMPAITVDDPTVAENGGDLIYTISLDVAADVDVAVDYATSDNTATDGTDYTGTSGTATITAGNTSTTVNVPTTDDTTYEGDEALNLDLSGEVNGTLSDSQGQGTITEDDAKPAISVSDVTADETDAGAAIFTFDVTLSNPSVDTVTVDFATANGSATVADADYDVATGTVTFAPAETATTVDVRVNGDTTHETDEGFTVDLANESNATIADGSGQGTITNDDPVVTELTITDVQLTEGNAGTKAFTFEVAKSGPSAATIHWATAAGSATAGSDFQAGSGDLSFDAANTSKSITVIVNGDTAHEGNETFQVVLSAPTGATVTDDTGIGTILNDDKQISTISLKAGRTSRKVSARGILEPASTGNRVTVTLTRYSNGRWRKVAAKTVSVTALSDRDADTLTDAAYAAAFKRPAVHGKYRLTALFGGDANTLGRAKKVLFKL